MAPIAVADAGGGPDEVVGPLDERIHRELLGGPEWAAEDGGLRPRVEARLREIAPLLPAAEAATIVARVCSRVEGLGPLDAVLADPSVSEVMVNGPGRVWVERDGRLGLTGVHLDRAAIELLIERVVAPLGLRVDRTTPIVDARLADGSRFHAVVQPLAIDGPYVTIRRFGSRDIPLAEFGPPGIAQLLGWAVRSRRNLIVSGGTGAGKTTLLNALAAELPDHERIVTIEDAAELRLPGTHVVRLEARPANADGVGRVDTRDLVRAALRMRPDRIIVGECRGGEAHDMLQAMNTGHEGSLSTCHANSPADAVRRLESMTLQATVDLPLAAVREQIEAAVDLIVQVGRTGGGERRITAIGELVRGGVDLLADESGLRSLPGRPSRPGAAAPGPDTAWLA